MISSVIGFWVTAKDSVCISKGRGWVNHPTPFPQQPGPKPVIVEFHSTMPGELLEIQSTEIIDPLLLYFTTTIFYLSNAMAARKIASFVGY